jgi:hypothetical protein
MFQQIKTAILAEEVMEAGCGAIWNLITEFKESAEVRDKKKVVATMTSVLKGIKDASDNYWGKWNIAPNTDIITEEQEEDGEEQETIADEYGCHLWQDQSAQLQGPFWNTGAPARFDTERTVVWPSKIDIILGVVDEEEEYERSADYEQINRFRTAVNQVATSRAAKGVDYCITSATDDGEDRHLFIVTNPRDANDRWQNHLQFDYVETYECDEDFQLSDGSWPNYARCISRASYLDGQEEDIIE